MTVTPREYRIVVEGELGPRYAAALDPWRLEPGPPGTTAIVGGICDQSELQGVISHCAGLGLALISVQPTGEG